MDQLHAALQLSAWALEFMLLPPIALILVIAAASVAWAALKQKPAESLFWKQRRWAVLAHLLFFPVAIAVGVLLPDGGSSSANRFGNTSLKILLCASLISCVFWIWRMKQLRWFAVGLMALLEMPVLGALFVAGMSVTGDWL